jgi:hypothetical protein
MLKGGTVPKGDGLTDKVECISIQLLDLTPCVE